MKSAIQNILLAAAASAHKSGLVKRGPGRWLYDHGYQIYKTLLEAPGIDHLRPLVWTDSWVIDVGANVGFFAERFAKWVSGSGRVIAIEAEPENMARLTAALAKAGLLEKVDLVEAAAVDKEGEVRLTLSPGNPADHRVGETGIKVRGATLDGIWAAHGSPKVGLVKMDIQGAEWSALQGAKELLDRDQPALFVELADEALQPYGVTGTDVTETLLQRGYRAHMVTKRGISGPCSTDEIAKMLSETWYIDVLFLSPAQADVAQRRA